MLFVSVPATVEDGHRQGERHPKTLRSSTAPGQNCASSFSNNGEALHYTHIETRVTHPNQLTPSFLRSEAL